MADVIEHDWRRKLGPNFGFLCRAGTKVILTYAVSPPNFVCKHISPEGHAVRQHLCIQEESAAPNYQL